MLYKPESTGGVLLAYAKTQTLAVVDSSPLTLVVDGQVTNTTAQSTQNAWNQLVLQMDRGSGNLHIYHWDGSGMMTHSIIPVSCSLSNLLADSFLV